MIRAIAPRVDAIILTSARLRAQDEFLYDPCTVFLTRVKPVRVNRRIRVRVVAITIFALLFAQWSVAAYACPSPTTPAADVPMTAGCEGMAGQLDTASPNLCAEHCQFGEQSDQLRTPTTPAVALISLYVVPLMSTLAAPSRLTLVSSGLLAARPLPHTVLHCCFRI